MAKPINATPVLKGEDAKRFIEELTQRYTLDQLKLAFKIDQNNLFIQS